MTTEESYQECMRKARSHLEGGPSHIPNALHYAYYAVARAANLPAAKRHAAMSVLQKAIRAAVRELPGMYNVTPENILAAGVVQDATEDSIQLEKTASTMDGAYIGYILTVHRGSGTGTMFTIDGYNGKEQRVTKVSSRVTARLDNTSYYIIR